MKYTQLGYGDTGTFNGLKDDYTEPENQCIECCEEIQPEYDLCENCATEKWNDKQFDREKLALQVEQSHDLSEPDLTWWHKPQNQTEEQYYLALAISKGYSD